MTPRTTFLKGFRIVSPMFLGALPFGLVAGVTGVQMGLTAVQTIGFSMFTFAGASQLAALQLLGGGAGLVVIVFTVFVINLRHVMYSASIAPHLQHMPLHWRLFLPFFMADQPYVLSILEFQSQPAMLHKKWLFLGMGIPLWTVWCLATAAGALLGAQIPPAWALDFIVPLVFMVLVFPSVKDAASASAAVVAGITAVVAKPLPYNLGLVTAAVLGIVTGVVYEKLRQNNP